MSADDDFYNNQATGSYSEGGALYLECISGCKFAYTSSSRFSQPLLLHVLFLSHRSSISFCYSTHSQVDYELESYQCIVIHADNTYSSNNATYSGGAGYVAVKDGSMMTLGTSGITILQTR
jgi:hypothetical protein